MQVILLEIKSHLKRKCVNKDLSGGMGTATWVGNSWRARIFERAKKMSVVLPEITNAYLAAIFKKFNWQVKVIEIKESPADFYEKADILLMPTSIVDCRHELKVLEQLKENGFYVGVFGSFATAVP